MAVLKLCLEGLPSLPLPLLVTLSISTDYFSEPTKLPHTPKLLHTAGTKRGTQVTGVVYSLC